MSPQRQSVRLAVHDGWPEASKLRVIQAKHRNSPGILSCEERFHTLVESVIDYAIFMLDPAGNVTTWNAGARRIKGYEAAEILGQHFSRFYPQTDIANGKPGRLLRVAADSGRAEDNGFRVRKDGSRFWANVVLTAVHDEQSHLLGFVKITRDLTEIRNRELALRDSEERFQAMIDGIVDYGIFMLSPLGIVTSWNTGAERLMGYKGDQIVGRDFACFFTADDVAAGLPSRELEAAASFGTFSTECWHLRSDGSRFWASVTISRLRDPDGVLTGYAKVTRDLTVRRDADEKIDKLRQDLERRNELLQAANADLEAFSRSMAHDMKAPVRHVLAYADILLGDFRNALPPDAINHLEHLKRSATRMSDLVRDLLGWFTISRRSLNLERVDLRSLVNSVVSEFTVETLNRKVEWRIDDLFEIQCDRGLAIIVFLNLIGNALKFSRMRDHALIEIGHLVTDEGRVIFVRDNGVGFDMQYSNKLFRPFERLHNRADIDGTGIGLTITARIVQKHGGRIWAHATPDRGATFSFTLEGAGESLATDASASPQS